IAASGTLAQIIPPSLVLIVLADQLGRSVGDMYTGAMLPGLMLAGLYAVFVFVVSTTWPHAAPGLPPDAIVHREPDGSRGYGSLAALLAACSGAAWLLMQDSTRSGADWLILTVTLAISLAIVAAGANWLIKRGGGPRLLSFLAEQVVFVMVPPL